MKTSLKQTALATVFAVSPRWIFGSGRFARTLRRFLLSNNSNSSALTVSADLGSPLVDEAIASGITVLRTKAEDRRSPLVATVTSPRLIGTGAAWEEADLYLARLRVGI